MGDDGEGLYVRGRTNHRDSRQLRGKSRSKSRGDDGDERTGSARLDHGFRMFIPHDTHVRYMFFDFLECNWGSVLLGDNKEYKIRGISKVEFKRISLTGFRSCTSRSRYRSISKQTTRHLPQSCLMLTLEGFPFITVNTKEYHFECSSNYHKDNA
ncbi:hypothetical protein Tco_0657509 [Tanacetum coccineum]|uniref:Uncharacterized protein n=1 Tax=Tanacetum coccineum TaxID=301880 RepID=A0ABQ4XCY0_9ASTR